MLQMQVLTDPLLVVAPVYLFVSPVQLLPVVLTNTQPAAVAALASVHCLCGLTAVVL